MREDLAIKRELFAQLESVVSAQTILATNTSSLKFAEMTSHLMHQDRVVIAHWFNPPHIVPVVEVVPGPKTSTATVDATIDLLRRSGKAPIRLTRKSPASSSTACRLRWCAKSGVCSIRASPRQKTSTKRFAEAWASVSPRAGRWRSMISADSMCGQRCSRISPLIRSDAQMPSVIRKKVDAGHFGPKTGSGIYDYPPAKLEKKRAERDARFLALAKLLWSDTSKE